jgi:hypothetical protein
VPVVVQAGFGLVPLAGESGVERRGAGDAVRAAPGLPDGGPHRDLGGVGHQHRPVEVVDADVPNRHARRADAVDHRQRAIHLRHRLTRRRDLGLRQPDVLADGARRRPRCFGNDVAEDVVDKVRGRDGAGALLADRQLLAPVVGVASPSSPVATWISILSPIFRYRYFDVLRLICEVISKMPLVHSLEWQ